MTPNADLSSRPPYRIVVFDIGGVLAKISHTWQEAARQAGVATPWDPDEALPLPGFLPLEKYQAGSLPLEEYLKALAAWAQCTPEEALRIHNSILIEEYPDVLDLVNELHLDGIRTGCLSNTNGAHWDDLTSARFPAIAALECKMASHLVGINKPDPAIYRLYAETHGVQPDEVVFFDDYQSNVDGANSVGFRAKRIDPNGDTAAQMREFLRTQQV